MEERSRFSLPLTGGRTLELGRRTRVMGILNVTPDSFSDGGTHASPSAALEAARRMVDGGVDILDVGGESTRPGAAPVDTEQECERVLPVISAIAGLGVPVSVDTAKAEVARRAIEAGADLVNDVSALADPEMAALVAERRVPVILMHMRGTPRTMQRDTRYDDVVREVGTFLAKRAETAVNAGVSFDKIMLDPGIGFGKSVEGNLEILRRLPELRRLERPIVIGASRKSFIGKVLERPVEDRTTGSLAVAAYAASQGAHVIRVHDVAESVQVVTMIDAIRGA